MADSSDRDLMIRTILGEAANQGLEGQAAVAHVIMNRLAAGRWGATPSAVVLAPNQFEPWSTRRAELMAIDPNSVAYRNVGDIVDMVQSGDIPDVTGGATHFLNEKIVRGRRGGSLPSWAAAPVAKIGEHTFYRPDDAKPAPAKQPAGDVLDAINKAIDATD